MSAKHLHVGDNVRVLTGKDRAKQGKVERINRERGRAWVGGIQIAKAHLKPTKVNPQGGIIDKMASVHISNLMIICPHCQKPTRVRHLLVGSKRARICTHCREALDGTRV